MAPARSFYCTFLSRHRFFVLFWWTFVNVIQRIGSGSRGHDQIKIKKIFFILSSRRNALSNKKNLKICADARWACPRARGRDVTRRLTSRCARNGGPNRAAGNYFFKNKCLIYIAAQRVRCISRSWLIIGARLWIIFFTFCTACTSNQSAWSNRTRG